MSGTFSFPFHRVRTIHPDNSARVVFGGSYIFTSKPNAPQQRIFILKFESMKFYLDGAGAVDATINANRNYKALRVFYELNQMWDSFSYNHPELGALTVKFNRPLEDPDFVVGGLGATGPFEIEFVEIPL